MKGGASRQTFRIVLNSDGSIVYQYAGVITGVINDVSTSIGVENQTMPDKASRMGVRSCVRPGKVA